MRREGADIKEYTEILCIFEILKISGKRALAHHEELESNASSQTDLQEEPFRSKHCLSVLNVAPLL